MIKKILEILPIIYISVVLYGYISLSTYYSKFDISIYKYLSAPEFLFPIYESTHILFFTVPILFFITPALANKRKVSLDSLGRRPPQLTDWEKTLKYLRPRRKIRFAITFILGYLPFVSILLSRNMPQYLYDHKYLFYNILIVWTTALIFNTLIEFRNFKSNSSMFSITIILMIALTCLTAFNRTLQAENKLQGQYVDEIKIETNIGTINSNDTIIFIGNTQGFIFLKDLYQEKTIVINMSSVNRFTIYEKSITLGMAAADPIATGRLWRNHPFFEILKNKDTLTIDVTLAEQRGDILILDKKYIVSSKNAIEMINNLEVDDKFRRKSINEISAPYRFIKKGRNLTLIKEKDTITVSFNDYELWK